MNSFKKSTLFVLIRTLSYLFRQLPMGLCLAIGRFLGWLGYHVLGRKRKVVYANLKVILASNCSPSQIRKLTRQVFINFIQSAVELLCLPKIKQMGFDKFVTLEGKKNIDQALAHGRGVIFLAIHSGSWELASVVGGVTNTSYYVVANNQSKFPQLDKMLNEYRTIAGAKVIVTGVDTKKIVKAMHDNEIVSMVLDQGGRHGLITPFFDKTATMSTGAMRLALKYGCAVCPVWMVRESNGKHTLKIFPALKLHDTGNLDDDIKVNIVKAVGHFEGLLRDHPAEYVWFYKVFKYSNQSQILILDDGRTGHLRQSQSVAANLREVLHKKGKIIDESTIVLNWRSPALASIFTVYAYWAQYFGFLKREDSLKFFLTERSYRDAMKYKADYVISCGSQAAGVNYILSQNHLAKSVSILTPGLVSKERFDLLVIPEHDKPKAPSKARLIIPKVSPNLIAPEYLEEQKEGLIKYYSHLKGKVRTKFGVLLGGDTKGIVFNEEQIRELIGQIKEAALHYNAEILITTSRRTSPAIEQVVSKELKNFERCPLCIIANQRNIPEAVGGILALSDLVIVSGESISMVSEALSSGKRTIVFSPHGRYGNKPRDKYEDFVLKLHDQGYLMVTSTYDMKAKITQLLSYKLTLKTLDDKSIIQKGLEAFV